MSDFLANFHSSAKKPVNVIFEGTISFNKLKYNILTFRYTIPKLNEN